MVGETKKFTVEYGNARAGFWGYSALGKGDQQNQEGTCLRSCFCLCKADRLRYIAAEGRSISARPR